jgi:hypothetical protein
MLRSLFLLTTSLLAFGGCSDDSCGPGGAEEYGTLLSSSEVTLTFGALTSSQNNDCPDTVTPAPDGVVSLTLEGVQKDGPGRITLCISRPDLLADGQPLGTPIGVHIIDLNGDDANGCHYAINSLRPIAGTATAKGLCDNGASKSGWALTIDGNVSLDRMCPTMSDTIAVVFQGTSAIKPK